MTKAEMIETLETMGVPAEKIEQCKTNPELQALIEQENSKEPEPEAEPEQTLEEYMNEKLSFKAIKDDGKYKDDIIVTVNGKNWQIKRGITVQIPRFVYMAIEDAERQKMHATMVSQEFEDQYKQNQKMNMM